MNKKALTMLILSCVFVTIAVLITVFDAYVSISSYQILFNSHPESFGEALGDVIGGIFLYVYTILLGLAVLVFSILTIPFDVILLKTNGKKWYSIAILVTAIVCAVAAITFVAMLPAVSKAQEAAKANSSSSIESVEALLLLL